ncbi:MAG: hypothetical protein GXO26_09070 [Crenarchaeota archaeon]|nr:hypothetical protein [Thermoproteota archaeon]
MVRIRISLDTVLEERSSKLAHVYELHNIQVEPKPVDEGYLVKTHGNIHILDIFTCNIYILANRKDMSTLLRDVSKSIILLDDDSEARWLIARWLITAVEHSVSVLSRHMLILPPLPYYHYVTPHLEYVDDSGTWIWDIYIRERDRISYRKPRRRLVRTIAVFLGALDDYYFLYETASGEKMIVDYLAHLVLQSCSNSRHISEICSLFLRQGLRSYLHYHYLNFLAQLNLMRYE